MDCGQDGDHNLRHSTNPTSLSLLFLAFLGFARDLPEGPCNKHGYQTTVMIQISIGVAERITENKAGYPDHRR